MADIRINTLATTAASTASDDFVAVDGSANGTRKLNAYSPTFGGNLTVSGTALLGTSDANSGAYFDYNTGIGGASALWMKQTTKSAATATLVGGGTYTVLNAASGGSVLIRIANADGITLDSSRNTTIAGNLTVSGTGQSSLSSSSALFAVGTSAPTSTNTVGVPQIVAESDLYSSVASIAHNTTDGNYGFFLTGKSRGTKASPLIVANGDRVGGYGFIAYDGAAYRTSAEIVGVIDGTPGAADLPTRLSFRVAADGSASPSEQMRLTSTGNLLLKSDGVDGGQKLQVAGSVSLGLASATGILTVQSDGPNSSWKASTSGGALWNRWLTSAGVRRGYYGYASASDSTFTILNEENGSLVLGTNNATALTLDSSQNATFAGDIRFSAGNSFDIGATGTRVRTAFIKTLVTTSGAPASASATGTAGTMTWDADYIYVCTATNTWKRVAIATW